MSQENVEIVRAAFDAYNRGDWDATLKDAAPNCEFDFSRATGPRRGVHSLAQVRALLENFGGFFETFESVRVEADEFIDAGEHVVVPVTLHARGRDGIEVEARPTNVWTIRDGAIVRSTLYQEREQALEAAGLREWAVSQENVELVRRAFQSVEAFWAMLDEHVVWDLRDHPIPDFDGVYVGRDAVVEASRHWWGTWTDYRLDAEELIDAGSSVVVVVHEQGRGKGSGAPFEQRFAQVWTFGRGRIIRWELFPDKAAALEAAGLRE